MQNRASVTETNCLFLDHLDCADQISLTLAVYGRQAVKLSVKRFANELRAESVRTVGNKLTSN